MLACGFKLQQAERFSDFDMIPGLKIEFGGFAPASNLDIVVFITAIRHVVIQQIWQAQLDGLQLRQKCLKCYLILLKPVSKIFNRCKQRGNVFPLCLRFADILRTRIALVAQVLSIYLQRLATLLQSQIRINVEVEPPAGQIFGNVGCRLPK